MEGFKVFEPDWKCRGYQYTVGQIFEEDVTPSCCDRGFHFCKELKDCFNYYPFNPDNKVARVVALGDIDDNENDKCCTNKIHIVEEISWEEVLRLVNMGKGNAGLCNSGNRNSGNRNSGDWNSGDWNSGNRNSGDWNKTCFSNGCFNTESPKIFLFNKLSDWTYQDWLNSDARWILSDVPSNVLSWIWSDDMTDEEKQEHPEHSVTGGYLKHIKKEDGRQMWWDGLSDRKKKVVMELPNFDKEIFKEITGIDVEQ